MNSNRGNPSFSVVISTFNRRDLVLQAVESVLRQTFSAYEIIVVVDGSNDGTAIALSKFFPGIHVLECSNRGIAACRNRGLAAATGDWVCFLDDDDLWHPMKLELAARYIREQPGCDALNNPHWYFAATENAPVERLSMRRDFVARDLNQCIAAADRLGLHAPELAARLDSRGNSFRAYLRRDRGVISSVIVKRFTLLRAGATSPSLTFNEDWTLFLNVSRLCEWHTLPFRLGFTRFHEKQITNARPEDMLFSLANLVTAWFTGQPFSHPTSFRETLDRLSEYGPVYRKIVGNFHWAALRIGEFRLAARIRTMGRTLLPRPSDYFYALIPPPVMWRWEKYTRGLYHPTGGLPGLAEPNISNT
jgi:glycosyltransferase involved in cell wall biosynthesis